MARKTKGETIPKSGKKKVRKVNVGFEPSEYQQRVFDYVATSTGNAVLSAVAGSGKTTTILAATKYINTKNKVLIIAFNKSVAVELLKRINGRKNVTVKTANALGYHMLYHNGFNNMNCVLDNYKYHKYVSQNIGQLMQDVPKDGRQRDMLISTITGLIDYARSTLCNTAYEIASMATEYGFTHTAEICTVVERCLQWGKQNTRTIDFKDQVWLPYALNLRSEYLTFDYVIIDEAQDLSPAMLNLFQRCFKPNSRFIAVGDENQSINMWAGAKPDIFDWFRNQPDTEEFTLPVTYRCDRKIVDFANKVYPGTVARDNAGEGEILDDMCIGDVNDGDMVLCRSNAPLAKAYIELLRRKKIAYIKGDYGKRLLALLQRAEGNELNADLLHDGVFSSIYTMMFGLLAKLDKQGVRGLANQIATSEFIDIYERIECLKLLAEGCSTKAQLAHRISDSFKEDGTGICLSTVHKAKGLEADRVFICCASALYSNKKDAQEWNKKETKNLQYVAFTRPRHTLAFIKETPAEGGIPSSGALKSPQSVVLDLQHVALRLSELAEQSESELVQIASSGNEAITHKEA